MACLGLHTFTLYSSCIFMCMAREESCHLCTPRGEWKLDYDTNHKNRQWARSQKVKQFSFLSTCWLPIDCSGKLPSSHSQSLGQQQKKYMLSEHSTAEVNKSARPCSFTKLAHTPLMGHWHWSGIHSWQLQIWTSKFQNSHISKAFCPCEIQLSVTFQGSFTELTAYSITSFKFTNMNQSTTLPSLPWQKQEIPPTHYSRGGIFRTQSGQSERLAGENHGSQLGKHQLKYLDKNSK